MPNEATNCTGLIFFTCARRAFGTTPDNWHVRFDTPGSDSRAPMLYLMGAGCPPHDHGLSLLDDSRDTLAHTLLSLCLAFLLTNSISGG